MKLGMYVMAPEPISVAYLINPSRQSVCQRVYPRVSLQDKRLIRLVPVESNTRNSRIVGQSFSIRYGPYCIKEESVGTCVTPHLC
jgi:hypothetical protein